jgi:hypothetical protein
MVLPEEFGWPQDIGALGILDGSRLPEADLGCGTQAMSPIVQAQRIVPIRDSPAGRARTVPQPRGWFRGDALGERRRGCSVRSDGGDAGGQMWAVLYDDGMSLTTASERIARSLAEAERQRGRRVTVRRLDDAETHPRGVEKPARPGERVAKVRSGREAPISRRYRARAGRWGAPAACRSRSRSARRSGSRGPNRSASPGRPPHPNRLPHLNRHRPWNRCRPWS